MHGYHAARAGRTIGRASCDDRGWNEGAWTEGCNGRLRHCMLAFIGTARLADGRTFTSTQPARRPWRPRRLPRICRSHRTSLTFTVGQPATIERISMPAQADVVILPSPVVAMLGGTGLWRAAAPSILPASASAWSFATGARPPDISNAAAISQAVARRALDRLSRSTSGGGSAGRAIARMIEEMGLTETIPAEADAHVGNRRRRRAGRRRNARSACSTSARSCRSRACSWSVPLPAELQKLYRVQRCVPVRNTTPGAGLGLHPGAGRAGPRRARRPGETPAWSRSAARQRRSRLTNAAHASPGRPDIPSAPRPSSPPRRRNPRRVGIGADRRSGA